MAVHIVKDGLDNDRIVKLFFGKDSGHINLGIKYEGDELTRWATELMGEINRVANESLDIETSSNPVLILTAVNNAIVEVLTDELNTGLFLFLDRAGTNDLIKKLQDAGRTTFGKDAW